MIPTIPASDFATLNLSSPDLYVRIPAEFPGLHMSSIFFVSRTRQLVVTVKKKRYCDDHSVFSSRNASSTLSQSA